MEQDGIHWETAVLLKKFLTISECPPRWKDYDLYLIRDEQVAFYAGQSYCAFLRVWDHLKSGPKGHSIIGQFVLTNWPRSGQFVIELLNSQGPRFAHVDHELDAAERWIIETYQPCLMLR